MNDALPALGLGKHAATYMQHRAYSSSGAGRAYG